MSSAAYRSKARESVIAVGGWFILNRKKRGLPSVLSCSVYFN